MGPTKHAKRREIKKKIVSVDEVSDPAAADASFRIIRVFRGPKSPPEQARTLMVQLSFVAFGLSAGGADLSCRIACAKMVTALLHDG
ncbi:MAG: hypothetical protein DME50_18055 [Verrucomicrobia bacterium]|nr:MAG: hypothetical protein DME50_18055 [Verrucomicrobiota bacterium]